MSLFIAAKPSNTKGATSRKIRVCSRGYKCRGSMPVGDQWQFVYWDKEPDDGIEITMYTKVISGTTYGWTDED